MSRLWELRYSVPAAGRCENRAHSSASPGRGRHRPRSVCAAMLATAVLSRQASPRKRRPRAAFRGGAEGARARCRGIKGLFWGWGMELERVGGLWGGEGSAALTAGARREGCGAPRGHPGPVGHRGAVREVRSGCAVCASQTCAVTSAENENTSIFLMFVSFLHLECFSFHIFILSRVLELHTNTHVYMCNYFFEC